MSGTDLSGASRNLPAAAPGDVLIVEDDATVVELRLGAFEADGLSVDVAATVAEANRRLVSRHYRVMLLDLLLPDGKGIEVLRFLDTAKLKPVQVIVMTAGESSLLRELERPMVNSIVFKPLRVRQLTAYVRLLAQAE